MLLTVAALLLGAAAPIDWWDQVRRGGNSFNRLPPDRAYFDALAGYGADWVRLTPSKWQGERRDFLIGDADRYAGIPARDLAMLRQTLDHAHAAGLKVVIAPLSLPGSRWTQHNGGRFDDRLWRDKAYWAQAASFWRDLAIALKDHPAVAGYNILNEPAPERGAGLAEHAPVAEQRAWYAQHRGTARDLPGFYRTVLAAIRTVDADAPVMLDTGWYAAADAFYWPGPIDDPAVLYAFHMYEPYEATSAPNLKRDVPFVYPGTIAGGAMPGRWDRVRIAAYLAQPFIWADRHGVPRTRIVAGEFGCMRRLPFCPAYLEDVLSALDARGTHWAFYAFREDAWDGMDYELGTKPVDGRYWSAMERGERDPLVRPAGALLAPIAGRLKRPVIGKDAALP